MDLTRHIYGNYWDLNTAAADRLACDKCGCYTLLSTSGIPAIEHTLVYNAVVRGDWMGNEGTFLTTLDYFKRHNRRIVIKPNQGTQGRDVYLCETPLAVENALLTIFTTEPDAVLSPYVEIRTEYRVFCLTGQAFFVYGKTPGESWKHNLAGGAMAFEVTDANLQAQLSDLALRAARCICITFASVDIAQLADGTLKVMEINSGIMANHLLVQLPHLRPTIKNLLAEAMNLLFTR
jgi:hypothetical protein